MPVFNPEAVHMPAARTAATNEVMANWGRMEDHQI